MRSARSMAGLLAMTALALAGCRAEAETGSAALGSGGSADQVTALPNPFSTMIRPWGQLPDGLEWGQVSAVDLDRDGRHVWAMDRCGAASCVGEPDRPVVLKLDPDGNVVTSFGNGMFIRPHGLFVDSDGNIWVTDHQNARQGQLDSIPSTRGIGQRVMKFSPGGELLMTIGTPGEAGDPPTHLNNPTDVIVAANGDIFISEGHSYANPPGRISRFSAEGEFLGSFGEFGSGRGQLSVPHALAFDSRGRLFVADRGNNRIQIFDQEGNLLDEMRQFGRPNDIFITADDRMYVIDAESGEEDNPGFPRGIYIGSARSGEVTSFIPAHEMEGRPEGTHGEGVVLDAQGSLYVAEVSLRGMTKYVP